MALPSPARVRARRARREAGWVLALVVALEFAIFRDYIGGSVVPPADFVSHYSTDAFAWWADGGFFDPPGWMPYMWGGYPAVLDLQNSSWYLPVGLVAEFATFDLRASATISALHVAFGAVGMYVLARRIGAPAIVSSLALVAWFFVGPFYSNSQHLDISRAYAWVPWVLLCLSPFWPWRRWWAVLVAGLVVWQALLAMYPGIVIAGLYCLPVWVVGLQLTSRARAMDFLVPGAVTTAAAAAMTLLRFLPYVLIRGTGSPRAGDGSIFSWQLLATTVFPYDIPSLPNDPSMRSFFVTAPVVCALALAVWRRGITRVCLAVVAVAVGLGLPVWPWSSLVAELPGLGVSRFRMSDFKVYLLAVLVVLAVVAIRDRLPAPDRATPGPTASLRAPSAWVPVVALLVVVVAAAVTGTTQPYPPREALLQFAAVLGCALTLAVLAVTGSRGDKPSAPRARTASWLQSPVVAGGLVLALVLAAAASGYVSVYGAPRPWRMDRPAFEAATYGAAVDAIVTGRPDTDVAVARRPPRSVPPGDAPYDASELFAVSQNRVHYAGGYVVAGYVNLYGTGSFDRTVLNLTDAVAVGEVLPFWAAPGIGITSADGEIPPPDDVAACVEEGDCGDGLVVDAVRFVPAGGLEYAVSATDDTLVSFNEAYYPGWSAQVCPGIDRGVGDQGGCTAVPVTGGGDGQILVDVPAGSWSLRLRYQTPGLDAAWACFAAGVLVILGWSASTWRRARRRDPDADDQAVTIGRGTPQPESL